MRYLAARAFVTRVLAASAQQTHRDSADMPAPDHLFVIGLPIVCGQSTGSHPVALSKLLGSHRPNTKLTQPPVGGNARLRGAGSLAAARVCAERACRLHRHRAPGGASWAGVGAGGVKRGQGCVQCAKCAGSSPALRSTTASTAALTPPCQPTQLACWRLCPSRRRCCWGGWAARTATWPSLVPSSTRRAMPRCDGAVELVRRCTGQRGHARASVALLPWLPI